ncbi:TPA: hypothetical protein ACYR9Z_004489 [Raoultella ornithinolytica]
MTTDITELAQILKAAAKRATPGQWVAFTQIESAEDLPAHHQRRLQHHINRMWLEKMPVPSIIGAARLLGRTTYTSKKSV